MISVAQLEQRLLSLLVTPVPFIPDITGCYVWGTNNLERHRDRYNEWQLAGREPKWYYRNGLYYIAIKKTPSKVGDPPGVNQ